MKESNSQNGEGDEGESSSLHLASQYLADSSLHEDLNQYDFTATPQVPRERTLLILYCIMVVILFKGESTRVFNKYIVGKMSKYISPEIKRGEPNREILNAARSKYVYKCISM